MADLTETVTYEPGIYQLELTDPVEAGPDGIDNRQAQQLANRTAYLKRRVDQGDVVPIIDPSVAPLVGQRGRLGRTEGAAGTPDSLYVALKAGDDSYTWFLIAGV